MGCGGTGGGSTRGGPQSSSRLNEPVPCHVFTGTGWPRGGHRESQSPDDKGSAMCNSLVLKVLRKW